MGLLTRGALAGLISAIAFGQPTQPSVSRPSFEVVSVKPTLPGAVLRGIISGRVIGGPGTPDPSRVTGRAVSLFVLIRQAYQVESDQVQGPPWMAESHYDFVAKVPTGATKDDVKPMLQGMLEERFKLALHHATKNLVVYDLTIAKGGSKLKENHDTSLEPVRPGDPQMPLSRDGFPQFPPGKSGYRTVAVDGLRHLTARGQSLSSLIFQLGLQLGSSVASSQMPARIVDKTGLTGNYDYNLEYVGGAGMGALIAPPGTTPERGGSLGLNFLEAMDQQLGLKLTKSTAPVDVLVIDHAERTPTGN